MALQIYSYVICDKGVFLCLQKVDDWSIVPIIFAHINVETEFNPTNFECSLLITKSYESFGNKVIQKLSFASYAKHPNHLLTYSFSTLPVEGIEN